MNLMLHPSRSIAALFLLLGHFGIGLGQRGGRNFFSKCFKVFHFVPIPQSSAQHHGSIVVGRVAESNVSCRAIIDLRNRQRLV
jgi:hypothetical protein